MNTPTELIRLAKKGDAHAFAQLYESVYLDLYRFAVYTLHHKQDAEDAVKQLEKAAAKAAKYIHFGT